MLAGVPALVHLGLFAFGVVALSALVVLRLRRRRPLHLSLLTLPLVVGALLTAFSLLPLPRDLRAFLSSDSVDRLERLALLLGPEAGARILPVLAFDPPEAALALLRLIFAACVVIVIAQQSRTRRNRSVLYRCILAVAFVTGTAVLLNNAVGHARFFNVIGVPVNPNHSARICGALALLCLGRALTLRPRIEASWFTIGGVMCALLLFASMSKGGIAAFVLGLFTLVAIGVRGRQAGGGPRTTLLTLVGAAAVLVGGLLFMGEDAVAALTRETLDQPEQLKTFMWEPASRLAAAEPLVGVGNNGFGVAFPSVLASGELQARLTYSHAENIGLQTLADHGLVGGGLLVFIVLGLMLVVVRTLGSAGELAAVPGIVFLMVGDMFDFVLETPAGLGLLALALGLLGGRLAAHRPALMSLRTRGAVTLVVVVVVGGSVAAVPAVHGWRYALDEQLAHSSLVQRTALLEQALAAHPSDATYATELAIMARRRRDPQAALRFANRALVLWPALGPAHLEAARAFYASKPKRPRQAMLEYRAAWMSGGSEVLAEVVGRTRDQALRRTALPLPQRAVDLAGLCSALVNVKRSTEARACFVDAAALPDASDVQRQKAIELAIEAHDLVDASARILQLQTPHDGDSAVLAARVQALSEGVQAALATSAAWTLTARHPTPLLQWRLGAQRSAALFADAEVTLGQLRPLARSAALATTWDLALVDVRQKSGDTIGALAALRDALASRPRDLDLLLAKLKIEVGIGDGFGAAATLRQMGSTSATDPRVDVATKLVRTLDR